jgi:hypothetical protein
MTNYNNAGRGDGRRVEHGIRGSSTDYIDLDAIAAGYRDGDPAMIRWLAAHLCHLSPEHQRETLVWISEHGQRLGGDA